MSLLSAIGCAPGAKASATTPVLADYDVALHAGQTLVIDPAAGANGRFQLAAGNRLVLEFTATRGKSAIAYDTASTWTVAVELPPAPDPTKPLEVTLDAAPAFARVAGEDVLYLARKARGRVSLTRSSAPVSGQIDLAFDSPERDLIKLGALTLRGTFKAAVK